MDSVTLTNLMDVARSIGIAGLVLVFWYFDSRSMRKVLSAYRDDIQEVRRFYENNVLLVQNYEKHAEKLESLFHETLQVVSLNTQTQTTLVNSIKHNEFCPVLRKETGQ